MRRVKCCPICGRSRCVQSEENPRIFYCFRDGRTYFEHSDGTYWEKGESEKYKKPRSKNEEFKFETDAEVEFDRHMGAIGL